MNTHTTEGQSCLLCSDIPEDPGSSLCRACGDGVRSSLVEPIPGVCASCGASVFDNTICDSCQDKAWEAHMQTMRVRQ